MNRQYLIDNIKTNNVMNILANEYSLKNDINTFNTFLNFMSTALSQNGIHISTYINYVYNDILKKYDVMFIRDKNNILIDIK